MICGRIAWKDVAGRVNKMVVRSKHVLLPVKQSLRGKRSKIFALSDYTETRIAKCALFQGKWKLTQESGKKQTKSF